MELLRYSRFRNLTVNAFGQANSMNGQMMGTVSDAAGSPIAGAKVKAANTETGYTLSVETSASGQYRFNILPLVIYDVTVDSPSFAPSRTTGINLSAGSATIDVVLQVQGVATEIVVSASNSVIDPSRTDQGSSLTYATLTNLPLVSRNLFNFILQQPNVSGRANTEFGVPRKLNSIRSKSAPISVASATPRSKSPAPTIPSLPSPLT